MNVKSWFKKAPTLMVGLLVGALVACSGSSSADTGLTQSQVQTMITAAVTPLESEITTLQSQVQTLQASGGAQPAVYIKAPNAQGEIASAIGRVTRATSAPACTGIGTLTGRPSSSDPMTSDVYSGISCTGYYFDISGSVAGGTSDIQQTQFEIGFDGANCTGDAYIVPWGAQPQLPLLAQAGAVFTAAPSDAFGMRGADWSNAANYWYLKAGTSPVAFTAASFYAYNQGCLAAGDERLPSPLNTQAAYPIAQNVPSVTGIPSAPIPGPVLISN